MKKVAILAEKMYEEMELLYPYYRLKEEGYKADIVGTESNVVYVGKNGYPVKSNLSTSDISADDYDAVIIPGGYSPDHMRRSKSTVKFVKDMDSKNKIIAAICHGPWMMASCCDLKGKDITAFYSIKDDLINAGANFVDREVVIDGNLITSRTPEDLIPFVKTIIESLEK